MLGRRGTCAASSSSSSSARSVVILPGLGNCARDYDELASELRKQRGDQGQGRGLSVFTVDVARIDWARNAAGLLDANWWRGTLKPRPVVDWYLDKVKAAVAEAKGETGGGPITLLAHSAGGWLGRCYLAEVEAPSDAGVDRFVSLGSPHLPPSADAEGTVDQTRGILTHVNEACPGAFHGDVAYVTICGKCIEGSAIAEEGRSVTEKITGQGYKQVCGKANTWGDGIVPCPSAHLEGALQITLDGVYHSPLGKGKDRRWYGDAEVVGQWMDHIYGTPTPQPRHV